MRNTYFNNYTLGEMEDTIDEYNKILDELMEMAKKTTLIDIEFLQDSLRDEYMSDIEEMQDIIAEAENETLPSRNEMSQDYINDRLKELR